MVRLIKPNRPPTRNYFSRREQWRLLLLVMSLGVVIIVMREVRKPENVAQVTRAFSSEETPADVGPPDAQSTTPSRDSDATAAMNLPNVRPEALAAIRDNTYFRSSETDAWFELISILQRTAEKDLAARSVGDVGYVELSQQPRSYRAKLVTVRGTVRQVTVQKPAANDLGLESYYRLVIQPRGGEIWPIFVYCLDLPRDFPRDENVAADVSATGFFFKNLSYLWRDGIGIAPVVLAKRVTLTDAAATSTPPAASTRAPTDADSWPSSAAAAATVPADDDHPELSRVLSLAGWDAERLAGFADGQPPSDDERRQLLELLWRAGTLHATDIVAWTRDDVSANTLTANPDEYRGQFVRFTGRVRRLESHALSGTDAARLEMSRYFECELALDNEAGAVTILTARVPQAWLRSAPLDEPATAAGLFIKRLPGDNGATDVMLVAPQIASDTFGRSVLSTLGMDVGLLDGIRNHRRILASERDAFYQMLSAAGRIGPNQLIRFAQGNLDAASTAWSRELRVADEQRRSLAREAVQRAAEGRYSVAPLFNDADRQSGQLIVVDGVARRIVRVDAVVHPEGRGASDAAPPSGIGHYYEMEVFTDDSQNRPLIFCVRELPAGLPTGSDLREPVRVVGFFFKSWLYRTRDTGQEPDDSADSAALGKRLIAPLVIGPAPLRLEMEPGGGQIGRLVGGALFLLALAGIWAAAWWFARGDRRFHERTLAASFSLRPGQSLNEFNLPSMDQPMNHTDRPGSDAPNST